MDIGLMEILIVLPFIFVGSLIDAIAGGGGVINMVGLMMIGLPPKVAVGTNKAQSLTATGIATFNYVRTGNFNKKFIPFSVAGAILGALGGAQLINYLAEDTAKILVAIILPIIALIMLSGVKPKEQASEKTTRAIVISSFIVGISVGFYDGFLGAGSGTLYIFAFSLCGLSLLEANGNSKIVNLIASATATIYLFMQGAVVLKLIIPCIAVNMIGAHIGSMLAIKNGERIVRPVMVGVLVLLIVKTVFDLLS